MPSLLDPLSEDGQRLLQIVAEGFAENDDAWPIWQYVMLRVAAEGANPEETLRSLPTWQQYYRPVSLPARGVPEPEVPIALTVHGMFHVARPATNVLLEAFLTALGLAAERQRGVTPRPGRLVTASMDAQTVTAAVNHGRAAPVWVAEPQLYSLLRGEPVTRAGISGIEDAWAWDLTRLRLQRFRGVTTAGAYLAALEEVVGTSVAIPAVEAQLPPLALPEAFDHLDLAWRAVKKGPLLRLRRATSIAVLARPAASGDEFASRCSALADLLKLFNLPGDKNTGSLGRLEEQLKTLLGDAAGHALDAVGVLRHVSVLRAGQQHTGGDAVNRAAQAHSALGLTGYGSDWTGAWDRVRAVAVEALTTIREEVATLIPD